MSITAYRVLLYDSFSGGIRIIQSSSDIVNNDGLQGCMGLDAPLGWSPELTNNVGLSQDVISQLCQRSHQVSSLILRHAATVRLNPQYVNKQYLFKHLLPYTRYVKRKLGLLSRVFVQTCLNTFHVDSKINVS